MNAFKQFWIQYADFSSKTSRAHFWLAFFWNFLISFASLGFFTVVTFFYSHQKLLKKYSIFQLFILKQVYGHLASLAFFYFLILVTQSSHFVLRRLRDAGIHWSWIFLNLGPVLLLFIVRARYFPISLGGLQLFLS